MPIQPQLFPGIILTILLGAVAFTLSVYTNINANLVAIVLGFIWINLFGQYKPMLTPGIRFCEVYVLSVAVALLGVQLNVSSLLSINFFSLTVIVSALMFTFGITFLLARVLRIGRAEACLVASGQGICGSAAVMASQCVIKAPPAQAGLVVALVNFLGFLGVFVTVWLADGWFNDSAQTTGLLIGNTLQSMGHVVAAGFSVNEEAGHMAVLIKMCRILLLIPVLLLLIFFNNKQNQSNTPHIHWFKLIPLFIWVFLILSFLASMDWIPAVFINLLMTTSKWLFLLAMVAIGLSIEIKQIYQTGGRLLILGVLVFAMQLVFSSLFLLYL